MKDEDFLPKVVSTPNKGSEEIRRSVEAQKAKDAAATEARMKALKEIGLNHLWKKWKEEERDKTTQ